MSNRMAVLTLALGFLLSGCAFVEQFDRNFQEALETYEAPENLDADPRTTGLLLVDAVAKWPLNSMSLVGVAIANVEDPETVTTHGAFRTGFLGQLSGVVVIPNLRPGVYRLIKIKTWNVNRRQTNYMPATTEFEIEVRANRPAYIGQIKVRQRMFSMDMELQLDYDKGREVDSWQMVVDKYKESEWAKVVEAHIADLGPQ